MQVIRKMGWHVPSALLYSASFQSNIHFLYIEEHMNDECANTYIIEILCMTARCLLTEKKLDDEPLRLIDLLAPNRAS